MLGAVVQAGADIASVSRPAWVAVAFSLNALAVAAAALAMSRATSSAVSTTPAVVARALSLEALAVAGAVVGACLLGTIVALEPGITIALHLRADGNALSVA